MAGSGEGLEQIVESQVMPEISITISYQVEGDEHWFSQGMKPEEYFDLDEGEAIEINCVQVYNHAIEYLNDVLGNVKATKIVIEDKLLNKRRTITERFWNEQKNRVIERTDMETEERYHEVIVVSEISMKPKITEIIRFVRDGGVLNPVHHGFIQTIPDGTESETKVIER